MSPYWRSISICCKSLIKSTTYHNVIRLYNQFNVFCWLIYMCIMMMFWVDCIEEEVNESSLSFFQWLRVIKMDFFVVFLFLWRYASYIGVPECILFICDVFCTFEYYDCNVIVELFRPECRCFDLWFKKKYSKGVFFCLWRDNINLFVVTT